MPSLELGSPGRGKLLGCGGRFRMSGELILYVGEKNISSWSMRAWVAMTEKGIEFEERTISLRADRDRSMRRRIGPTGRLPVLHHASEGRKWLLIPDSLAIIEYLEESFIPPRWHALWPSDPAERAHARWLAATMHSGFAKLREGMSFNLCFLPRPPEAPAEALAEAAEMLGYWERALESKTDTRPFLFGPFGAVDAMFAPAVVRLSAFHVPVAGAPRAAAYMDSVLSHPSVRKWLDEARTLPPAEVY